MGVAVCVCVQRWRRQAREYRQKQLLTLDKVKHSSRLYVPDIVRDVTLEDKGNEDPLVCPAQAAQPTPPPLSSSPQWALQSILQLAQAFECDANGVNELPEHWCIAMKGDVAGSASWQAWTVACFRPWRLQVMC